MAVCVGAYRFFISEVLMKYCLFDEYAQSFCEFSSDGSVWYCDFEHASFFEEYTFEYVNASKLCQDQTRHFILLGVKRFNV